MSKTPWFARIREGLFKDPSGKHRKRMGEAIWLYGYFHICADLETGQLVRTYKTITNDTGISERTARRMVSKLQKYGYIHTNRLARGLAIQITKWESVKKTKRAAISGLSKIGESGHLCPSDRPPVTRAAISGLSPTNENNRTKHGTSATSGRSNETPLTRPNPHGDNSSDLKGGKKSSKSKESKPTNPGVKVLMDHYHDEFLRIHDSKPEMSSRDGKEFKTLLETNGRGLDDFKELLTDYLSLKDSALVDAGFPVAWFPGRINGLLMKKKQPKSEFVY